MVFCWSSTELVSYFVDFFLDLEFGVQVQGTPPEGGGLL
jgi:hypothetical protein